LTLVKNSLKINTENFETIDFLKNCLVEIYGIEFTQSYQHAFVYIRQLALTLKKCFDTKKDVKKNL
jgi:nucleolar complex protein 2